MIREWKSNGYLFHLFFVWVPSPEVSIHRVRERVRAGGHGIPEETIRRRYQRGLANFFTLYQPLADSWRFLDNTSPNGPRQIAEGSGNLEAVADQSLWNSIRRMAIS